MFAVVYVPDFALQAALRHTPERRLLPVGLLPEKTPRARLWHCTEPALAAGVSPGMTPSQGQARCPELQILLRSAVAEECARAALLDGAGAFSPYVEDTAPGVCTLEMKGGRELAPAEWAGGLLARLERLHLRGRVGLAPSAGLARLAAQSAPAEPGWRSVRAAAELHGLPLQALGFSEEMREILRRWGIRDLGAFVALGREALAERLGPEVLPFFAQAAGTAERPLRCLAPAESYTEAVEFEHEVETLEPLLFVLRRLLEQIACRLEATYLVAATLTLRLGFSRHSQSEGAASEYVRTFKIPAPTARVEVLFRALHTHLEKFTAEQPIVSLRLEARPCRPSRQQFDLFESALRDPNQFFETLARLIGLLGNDRVGVPMVEDAHRPDSFRLGEVELEVRAGQAGVALPALAPRPTLALCLRRFRPPLRAEVELDARRRPLGLISAALRGQARAVQGPIRLSGEWWDERGWKRAEWEMELTDGTLCRVAQERRGWFLEGIYD